MERADSADELESEGIVEGMRAGATGRYREQRARPAEAGAESGSETAEPQGRSTQHRPLMHIAKSAHARMPPASYSTPPMKGAEA